MTTTSCHHARFSLRLPTPSHILWRASVILFFELSPESLKVLSIGTGERTVHCKIAYQALKDLGVDCFSVLCQGGNQPLDEFLDQNHPSMKLWTSFSDVQGY